MLARIIASISSVLVIGVAPSAMAVTIYEYAGNNYTTIVDNTPPAGTTYTTSLSVTGSFSVDTALAPNLLLTDITADIVAYSFSDGVHALTQDNSQIFGAFNVATDASGNISEWQLTLQDGGPLRGSGGPGDQRILIQSASLTGFVLDRGILQECTGGAGGSCGRVFSDLGQVANNPGSWTKTSSGAPVPEPSAALTFAVGFAVLSAAQRRRHRAG